MAEVNIALETFGTAVSLLLLLCCILEREKADRENKLFIAMLASNAAALVCDAFTWILEEQAQYETLLYILNSLVYILGYVIAALFTAYLVRHISRKAPISANITKIIVTLCGAAAALVFVSLGNHMLFSFENGIYVRGEYFWLSQAYPVFIILVDMIIVLRHRKSLGLRDTLALLTYGVMPTVAMLVQIAVYGITLLYLATTLSLLIIYIIVHVEQGRRLQEKEMELQKMSVAIMLSQIQPHFLYNSLSAIQNLCHGKAPEAELAAKEFSEFLRGNLDSLSADKPISFQQELKHTENYLALEKVRFKDRLNIEYDIQTTLFRIPALTLQPVAENAVCHGVTRREEGGTVKISSRETENAYVVTVEDNGPGFDITEQKNDGRSHLGVGNVRSRLRQMCGGEMTIESELGIGTKVVLTIPKGDKQL